MKVKLHTNVDRYNEYQCWPELSFPPRIGEIVEVRNTFVSHFRNQKLPTRMEVIQVTHSEFGILCDLWFTEIDIKIMKQNGVNPLM